MNIKVRFQIAVALNASLLKIGVAHTQSAGDIGGAGVTQTPDSSQPLAQICPQNNFVPTTRGTKRCAKMTGLRAIIPMHLNNYPVPAHIIRRALPIPNRANKRPLQYESQGAGDLTLVGVESIPHARIHSTVGDGEPAIQPTCTDRSIGIGERQIASAAIGVIRVASTWVICGLVHITSSFETNAHELKWESVLARLIPNEWYADRRFLRC